MVQAETRKLAAIMFTDIVGTLVTVRYLPFLRLLLSPPQPFAPNTEATLPPLPLPDKPSIVVLPFANMSNDPSQDYFSDGITEDITTGLSRLSSLFVISRNTAFFYKGKAVKLSDLSKELGVQYVLEGSVRRADGQVRVTAQLIDATNDHHLWAERYDRPLKDIFALQDEIVQKIVTTLKLQLTLMEQGVLVRKTTDNLEAYDTFLRGLESSSRALYEASKAANTQTRHLYEHAIELDPAYVGPYTGLGGTYFLEYFYRWDFTPQTLARAGELARQDVMLDESFPPAHVLLGFVYLWQKQQDLALQEAERTVALNPNLAEGYSLLGSILSFNGRPEEGAARIQQAMRLNPRYPPLLLLNLSFAYRLAGRYDEAISLLKKLLARQPNFPPAYFELAICYAQLDRLEEARAAATEMQRLNPFWSLEGWKQRSPYKDPAFLERDHAALRKAGFK